MDDNRNILKKLKYVKSHQNIKKKSAVLFLRQNTKKNLNFEWEPPKIDEVIYILKKHKKERINRDIKILSDYLSVKLDYFKKLKKESDPYQYEKTLSVLKYEEVKQDKNIVTYDEEGDKCYILLEGLISIYKPIYTNIPMTLREYISYLKDCDVKDPSTITRKRIMAKNNHIEFDIYQLMKSPIFSLNNLEKYNIFVENFEKVYEAKDGFSFGESALLHKQKRNATVKAEKLCKLIYIDKYDYNRVLKEIEKKRIDDEIQEFIKKFNFLSKWPLTNVNKLYSLMTNVELYKNEFIYKQNEESNYIYFCIDGTYEIYSLISLVWKKEFIKYISNSRSNFFLKINPNRRMNDLKLIKTINEAKKCAPQSPMLSSPFESGKFHIGLIPSNDIDEIISSKEEKFSDPYDLFKVNMNDLDSSGILGLEEAVEFKRRYTSIKVKSNKALLKKIKTLDFFKVLISNRKEERDDELMLNYICEKKRLLAKQISLAFTYEKNRQMEKFINEYNKHYEDGKSINNIKINNYINTLSVTKNESIKTKNIFLNQKTQIKKPNNLNFLLKSSIFDSSIKKNNLNDLKRFIKSAKRNKFIKNKSFSPITQKSNNINISEQEKEKMSPIKNMFSFSSSYKSQKNIKFKDDFKKFVSNNNETTLSSNNKSDLTSNLSRKKLINFKQSFRSLSDDINEKTNSVRKSRNIMISNLKFNSNKNVNLSINKNIFMNTINNSNNKYSSFNLRKYKKKLYFKSGFFMNEIIKMGIGPKISLRKEDLILSNDDCTDTRLLNIESAFSNTKAFSKENESRKKKSRLLKLSKL